MKICNLANENITQPDKRMKSITFSNQQIDFLRKQYEAELTNAEEYLEQIKGILKKLGAKTKEVRTEDSELNHKAGRKRGRKPKPTFELPKVPKKRGRKPKVMVPILEALKAESPDKKQTKTIAKKKVSKRKNGVRKGAKVSVSAHKVQGKEETKPVSKSEHTSRKDGKPGPLQTINKSNKKRPNKKRPRFGVSLKPLSKPLPKKESEAKREAIIESIPDPISPIQLPVESKE